MSRTARLIASSLGLLVAVVLAVPAQAATISPRVYGGTDAAAGSVPFQVALYVRPSGLSGWFCGGVVRDATHVITAAHCTKDPLTQELAPASAFEVLAGTTDRTVGGQRRFASAVTVHPGYDRRWMTNDVALLTLSEPLIMGSAVAPIQLVSDEEWSAVAPGRLLQVSGWGSTEVGPTTRLKRADVPLRADEVCDAQYDGLLTTELMLCAGDGVRDSCSGDSGGPLALDLGTAEAPDWRLVGVVSFGGEECASATQYGVYSEVAAPGIRSFLQTGEAPPVAGTPTVDPTPDTTGTTSDTLPAPAPAPLPLPAPTDTVAPVATVARAACTRTRCVLDLRVVDAGYSSGVRRVEATVTTTYRTRCRRGRRSVACTRRITRRVRATRVATGRYRLVTSGLRAGVHRVAVRALDAAGNRQIVAARRTLRTPARRR
jgi:trypsin